MQNIRNKYDNTLNEKDSSEEEKLIVNYIVIAQIMKPSKKHKYSDDVIDD